MRILQFSNPEDNKILSTVCEEVQDIPSILPYIKEMEIILNKHKKSVGIASNQIGITKRFFIISTPDNHEIYINPVLVKGVGSTESIEGCLSSKDLPTKSVMRFKKVYVEYTDYTTKYRMKQTLEGLNALVFQHELDHLNGITI